VDERWGPDDVQGGDSIVLHDGNSEKLVCPCIYVLNVADAFEHAHDSALTQTLADTRTNLKQVFQNFSCAKQYANHCTQTDF
jgi:hypothetical protein